MILRLLCIGSLILANFTALARYRNFTLNETSTEEESSLSDASMLMISLYKPTFNQIKYYDSFYKDTGTGIAIHSGRYFFQTSAYSVGLGFGLASYHDEGFQQKAAEVPITSSADLIKVDNAELTLSLFSYQLFILNKLQIPGFSFFDINVLLGYEEIMFEEVRSIGNTSETNSASTATSTTDTAANAVSKSSDRPIVNTGWHNNFSINVSFNFLLNWLDESSVRALEKSQGFSKVYLSPYINITNKISNKLPIGDRKSQAISFANTSYGVAFLFETD